MCASNLEGYPSTVPLQRTHLHCVCPPFSSTLPLHSSAWCFFKWGGLCVSGRESAECVWCVSVCVWVGGGCLGNIRSWLLARELCHIYVTCVPDIGVCCAEQAAGQGPPGLRGGRLGARQVPQSESARHRYCYQRWGARGTCREILSFCPSTHQLPNAMPSPLPP